MSVKEDTNTIINCYSGADGGMSFVQLRTFLEGIEEGLKKQDGSVDPELMQLLVLHEKYARLIKAVSV